MGRPVRDLDKNPYSKDEARVAEFFSEKGILLLDDPINMLLVGYESALFQRNQLRSMVRSLWETAGEAMRI